MHTDIIWRFIWLHLHIITWLLYSTYLLLLLQARKQIKIDKDRDDSHNGLIDIDSEALPQTLMMRESWFPRQVRRASATTRFS